MSMNEVQREMEKRIQERKYREEKKREQIQTEENTMRNETVECVDDFENPHERSLRYFKMDEINANIIQERAQASMEQDKNIHDTQTKEERGL